MSRFYLVTAMIWLATACSYAGELHAAKLRDYAQVQGKIIFLSDLLASADASARQRAAAIALGGSPQPGTVRILSGAELARRLASKSEFQGLQIPEQIVITHPGWSVDRNALWTALANHLREQGWSHQDLPTPASLRWPEAIRTLDQFPRLEISGMDWSPTRHVLQVRVRCSPPRACGCFLVEADSGKPAILSRKAGLIEHTSAPISMPFSARKHAGTPVITPAGKRAVLFLEAAGMRISLPVIALERGAMGQQIRAREWHGHRIYRAEVIGPGLLRASL